MEKKQKEKKYLNDDEFRIEYIRDRINKNLNHFGMQNGMNEQVAVYTKQKVRSKIFAKIINFGYRNKAKIKKIYLLEKVARKIKPYFDNLAYEKVSKNGNKVVKLEDLKQGNPIQFINNLYREILLREPDEDGMKYFLSLLNEGVSKEALIYEFSISEEAKIKGTVVDNVNSFEKNYRKHKFKKRVKKIPILTGMYRFLTAPKRIYELNREFGLFLMGLDHKQDIFEQRLNHKIENTRDDILNTYSSIYIEIKDFQREQEALRKEIERLSKKINQFGNIAIENTSMLYDIKNSNKNIYSEIDRIKNKQNMAINCGDNVVITQVEEFILGIPAEEWRLAGYMAFRGQLEPGLTKLFRSFIKDDMVVVDIGANIGVYTLIAGSLVGDNGKVYSFEPTPRIFNILKDNVQVNGLLETNRITLKQMAISDNKGTAEFAVHSNNNGHNTLFPTTHQNELITVQTISLDEVLSNELKIDIIKIDVEGAEPFVLRGMRSILKNNPYIIIFMEIAPAHLLRAGVDIRQFISEIKGYGLSIKKVDDFTGEVLPVTDEELATCFSMNIILKHRSV